MFFILVNLGVIPFPLNAKPPDIPPFPEVPMMPTTKATLGLINRDFNLKYSKPPHSPDTFIPIPSTAQSLALPNPALLAAAMLASSPSGGVQPPPPPNPLAVSHVLNALVGMAGLGDAPKPNSDPILNAMMKWSSSCHPVNQFQGGNFNASKPDTKLSILNILSSENGGGPRPAFTTSATNSSGLIGSPNGSSSTKSCCVSPKSGNSEGTKHGNNFGHPPASQASEEGMGEQSGIVRRRCTPSSSSLDGKQCIYCDKRFTCSSALRIHFRKHSGMMISSISIAQN